MKLIFVIVGLCFCKLVTSSESGDCEGLENIPGRNKLFGNALEVDPCASVKIQSCLPQEPSAAIECTKVSQNRKKFLLKILTSAYNSSSQGIKVTMLMSLKLEFYIQAYMVKEGKGDLKYDSTKKLGYFEDLNFGKCNSYACCNTNNIKDVARRCPSASPQSPSALPGNSGFYSIAYLWHSPETFEGDVIFIGSFIQSPTTHWEMVQSSIIPVKAATSAPETPTKFLLVKNNKFENISSGVEKTERLNSSKGRDVEVKNVQIVQVTTEMVSEPQGLVQKIVALIIPTSPSVPPPQVS